MKKIHLLILMTFFSLVVGAQAGVVSGTIQSPTLKTGVANASVQLFTPDKDTLFISTVSSPKGFFKFDNILPGNYLLQVTHMSFDTLTHAFRYTSDSLMLPVLMVTEVNRKLQNVVISTKVPAVRQRSDTVEYSANQYKVNPDASAEDLVQKMPGVTLEGGKVKAQGEDVRKVLIDGKEFFGDDATLALRNLPAEIIDKVQVFDRLSDQAQFTGFDDGDTYKAINIVTRAGIGNSQFGKLYAGYGTHQRYMAGGNVNIFNGDSRISLIGMSNNVNQQNFSSQDILGVVTANSGGRRGGGGGGRRAGGSSGMSGGRGGSAMSGGGPGGNPSDFMVGQQAGINNTHSFGINHSDEWGAKWKVNGSYFFNGSKSFVNQLSNTEYFLGPDTSQLYRETNSSESNNTNHRLNLRLEYKMDSANMFVLTPSISIQGNGALNSLRGDYRSNTQKMLSQILNDQKIATTGYVFRNSLLYRHAFDKRGRSLNVGLNVSLNEKVQDRYTDAFSTYYNPFPLFDTLQQFTDYQTAGNTLGARINYTEPIGKGLLQLSYQPSYSFTDARQHVLQWQPAADKYATLDTSLSNAFENVVTAQTAGISYRLGNKDKRISFGVNYQHTTLDNQQQFPASFNLSQSFSNFLPNAFGRLNLSTRSSLNFMYRTQVSTPSIGQLQNVLDVNDPLFISTGNPDLKQQYSHSLSTRYTFTNTGKGQVLMANLFVQQTSDYISQATFLAARDTLLTPSITLYKGSQLSKPVNLDGYWSLRSLFTFGMPVSFLKSNLNMNGGFNYNVLPGLVNNQKITTQNYTYNLGLVLGSNISPQVDFTTSFLAGYNVAKNSLQPELNNNYYSHAARLKLNLLSNSGWKFETDLTNQFYKGLTEDFRQNFWLWNAGIGKKFLKDDRGELKLSVFDLLKQNQSLSRHITETYLQDVQTAVLQQYFMVSFVYSIRNFRSKN